jgi:hypothetical protein
MKRKILVFAALAVMAMNLSSCIVREDGRRHWHHHRHHDNDATIIVR